MSNRIHWLPIALACLASCSVGTRITGLPLQTASSPPSPPPPANTPRSPSPTPLPSQSGDPAPPASGDKLTDADHEAWRADVTANESALLLLRALDKGRPLMMSLAKTLPQALALDRFAARCERHERIPTGRNGRSDDLIYDPKYTCGLAKRRLEVLKSTVPAILEARRKYAKSSAQASRKRIASGELVAEYDLACGRTVFKCDGSNPEDATVEQLLGLPTAATSDDEAAFRAAWRQGAAKRRVGSLRDATRERLVSELLAAKGIKPLALGLYASADEIEKDGSIPRRRYRVVAAVIKVGDEPFCRSYAAHVNADYAGGGRYGRMYATGFDVKNDRFLISACR